MATIPELHESLETLFRELVDGPPSGPCYILNPGDPGLLRSLDGLTAAAASARPASGGASIAAHVDHVCYGFELMNRWGRGEPNPWADADWTASWGRTMVSDEEWAALRRRLKEVSRDYLETLRTPRELPEIARNGMIAGVAHLAYHLGAMRQIDPALKGPPADG